MSEGSPEIPAPRPPRRVRYSGKNPRRFDQKYKELHPEKFPEVVAKVIASGKTPAGMHRPICVEEILEVFRPRPGEIVVDATLGFGGHAEEILKRILPGGKLIGIDVDPLQLPRTSERLLGLGYPNEALVPIRSNYAALSRILGEQNLHAGADMVLADLGVSSMQLDDPARGFSYKTEGPLDCRMNPQKGAPASAVLARATPRQLEEWLRAYSDEPRAAKIVQAIIQRRDVKPLMTTTELGRTIEDALRAAGGRPDPRDVSKTIARVFQAIRIAVNDELTALDTFLRFLPGCLKPGGRAAVLTFHSGEDRRVKKAFLAGLLTGAYRSISTEALRPSAAEIVSNPRASSAKLRWAIRA
jgi:16S rRNA (cytosine1402-N4)-methyltransferase